MLARSGVEQQSSGAELFMAIERSFPTSPPSSRPKQRSRRALPTGGGVVKRCVTVAVTLAVGSISFAQDELPISGTYRQGRPCRGDDTSSRAGLVTITPQQIVHPGGVCTIDDKRQEGDTVVLRTTCRDKRGKVLSGDVSFTIRDNNTLDMSAQDGSYRAVLNRCSEPPTRPPPERR